MLVCRFFEEFWNQRNLAAADEFVATDYIGRPPGPAGFKQRALADFMAFPDLRVTLEEQIAEGDKVAIRWTAHGTNTESLFGMAATNKVATITGISLYRLVAGKIVEQWTNFDDLGMFQQLGVISLLGQDTIGVNFR